MNSEFVKEEVNLQSKLTEDQVCYKCEGIRSPLTKYYPEFYYLPCWDCIGDRKSDRLDASNNIVRNIKEFYQMILGDRYFHLFISDPYYYNNTIPHNFHTFKKVLGEIELPSRNDTWFVSWKPGFPKMICEENVMGLEIVNLSKDYRIEVLDDKVVVGDFEIYPPEIIPYDSKHHYRYSIFNTSSDRKIKRVKISDTKCIRLYSTNLENVKSIFRVHRAGNQITSLDLSEKEFSIIKLSITRCRAFMKLIMDSVLEILKLCKNFKDDIFLGEEVLVNFDKEKSVLLTWNTIFENPNYINISII